MKAVRIRKKLDEPIPQLPELAPWVGRVVEIIVLDESDAMDAQPNETEVGAPRFEDLVGGWPDDARDDGFEQAVQELRRRPWTRSAG